jgi:hypothetical protein
MLATIFVGIRWAILHLRNDREDQYVLKWAPLLGIFAQVIYFAGCASGVKKVEQVS